MWINNKKQVIFYIMVSIITFMLFQTFYNHKEPFQITSTAVQFILWWPIFRYIDSPQYEKLIIRLPFISVLSGMFL